MGKIQIPGSGGGGTDTDGATATTNDILKGKTAAIAGQEELATGTLEVQSIINFNSALSSSRAILLTWQLPAKGPYSGVYIMYGTDKYPESISDGTLAYEGALSTTTISSLPANATCYFRAWPYMTTNMGRLYGRYADSSAVATEFKGQQAFTGSTTWTVPANVYSIDVFCVGGGGYGNSADKKRSAGGGGGGGRTTTVKSISVSPGAALTIVVGAAQTLTQVLKNGASVCAASGGTYGGFTRHGGYGGSGGGYGGGLDGGQTTGGWNGGANGGTSHGSGQGSTTRAFGESSNTLYAGGGGGGGFGSRADGDNWTYYGRGVGGGGGGGSGGMRGGNAAAIISNTAGAYGTGGGGGGGGSTNYNDTQQGCSGGSGIAIIRWGY